MKEPKMDLYRQRSIEPNQEDTSSSRRTSIKAITNVLMLRQHGIQHRQYQSMALESKLKGLDLKSSMNLHESVQTARSFTCTMILANEDIDYVATIWTNPATDWTQISFHGCLGKQETNSLRFATDTMPLGIDQMSDACIVPGTQGRSNLLTCSLARGRIAVLYTVTEDRSCGLVVDYQFIAPSAKSVYCCAYSSTSQRAAFGALTGGEVHEWGTNWTNMPNQIYSDGYSLCCNTFDSSGQIIYWGTDTGKIFHTDLRCNVTRNYCTSCTAMPESVTTLRILKNDCQLVVSGDSNQLVNFDLRMKRTMVSYDGHVSVNAKIPFTVNEDLGVLCSPGQDGRTRLWDLNSGRLAQTVEVPNGTQVPCAAFKSSWGKSVMLPTLLIGYDNKMEVYHG